MTDQAPPVSRTAASITYPAGGECRNGCVRARYARGLCHPCYLSARDAGSLPPTLISNPREADGRRADYAELRSWGLSVQAAARRVGVCLRTAERYEAASRHLDQPAPARAVPAVPLVVLVDECQHLSAAGVIAPDAITALIRGVLTRGRACGVTALHTINRPTATPLEVAS